MPEIKVVLYIMGGIGYFIYSIYKKNKEEQEKKALAEQKRKASTQPPPVVYQQPNPKPAPKGAESFDDYNKRTTAKPSPAKKVTKPIAAARPSTVAKPKQFLIADEGASFGGEGTAYEQKYTRPITSEEKIHDEITNSRAISGEIIEEEVLNINVREALIGSFIFERKF
jgi:hypothetical protein